MKQTLYIFCIAVAALMMGCMGTGKETDKGTGTSRVAQSKDTLYTVEAAMSIYGYQPVRALHIIDSAVIVGNVSEVVADIKRARIYGATLMKEQLDSLLGGPKGVGLDTARIIGERLLSHDSVKLNLQRQKDVLEILTYTARMQADTTKWLQRSSELVDVCHQIGAEVETDALRTEAEIGAALCSIGQQEKGMAKLDSVINVFGEKAMANSHSFRFNELDALIIALKRKIMVLCSHDKYAETLPLARRIIECLDDYEQHPDAYHDDSNREPENATKRADYISFYRNQAQNFITAAYTSLSEHSNMLDAFAKIELNVRDATAREHITRYNALLHQMEAERQEAKAQRAYLIANTIGVLSLLAIAVTIIVFFKNRTITRKNRLLAQQIADNLNYKEHYWEEKRVQAPIADADLNTLTDEQLFQHINEVIVQEKLFLDPKFERQTIMDRFQMSKERVGAIFSKGNDTKLNSYILQLRLEYAAKQLVEHPEKSIVQIATDSGFSSHTYFSSRFRRHFSISPTNFRQNVTSPSTHSV